MIEAEGLTKRYGSYLGIDNVSFKIEAGEAVGLLGPNGAGKTTTLRILTCAMSATSGRASVAGCDLFKQSMQARRHIGYLPETPPLYPEMTVEAYLRFAAAVKGVAPRKTAERIGEVAALCGLEEMRKRVVGHLSKGYRQRVGIAQALIHEPQAVVLDEPTSGLDPAQIVEIRGLIQRLGQERTVLLTTHILSEAQASCGRLLVINKGRIVGDIRLNAEREAASVQTESGAAPIMSEGSLLVAARPFDEAMRERLTRLPGAGSVQPAPDEDAGEEPAWLVEAEPGADIRAACAAAVVQAGGELLKLAPARPSLERLFLDLTQQESGDADS